MAGCGRRESWAVAVTLVALTGCGHKQDAAPAANESAGEVVLQVPNNPAPAPAATETKADPRLQQSFAEATLPEPPDGAQRPPDVTVTGKRTGKLYTEINRLWDTIRFTSPGGKRLAYQALLDTELGSVTITLQPELAPNHVRSFVALARVGYYDGLTFERTVRVAAADPDERMELIEAGCPLGTGELGHGSIGYWLKPEIDDKVTHEDGTVGAARVAEADAGACKFYINLCRAPSMDGEFTVFGKVTGGLDVAKKILAAPVRTDADAPEGDRPAKPVVIRKVTIVTKEAVE